MTRPEYDIVLTAAAASSDLRGRIIKESLLRWRTRYSTDECLERLRRVRKAMIWQIALLVLSLLMLMAFTRAGLWPVGAAALAAVLGWRVYALIRISKMNAHAIATGTAAP